MTIEFWTVPSPLLLTWVRCFEDYWIYPYTRTFRRVLPQHLSRNQNVRVTLMELTLLIIISSNLGMPSLRKTQSNLFIALIFIYPIFGMTYVITGDKFRTTEVCTSLEIFLRRHSLADVLGSVQVRQMVSGSCRNVLQTRGPTLLVPMMYCLSCSSLSGVATVSMLTHSSILCPLIGSVHSAGTDFGIFLIFCVLPSELS